MSTPENPAERGPQTRTDDPSNPAKEAQRKGNSRPDRDLSRGAEGDTRRASSVPR